MSLTSLKRLAVGLAAAFVLMIVSHAMTCSKLSSASADLVAAQAETQKAQDAAHAAIDVANTATLAAQVANAQRDSETQQVATLKARAQADRAKLATMVVPETCATAMSTALLVIEDQDSTIAHYDRAFNAAVGAAAFYSFALDSVSTALMQMQAAAIHSTHAEVQLVKAAKKTLLQRLTPHAGLGAAAGVDAFGRPNMVYGITFGITF